MFVYEITDNEYPEDSATEYVLHEVQFSKEELVNMIESVRPEDRWDFRPHMTALALIDLYDFEPLEIEHFAVIDTLIEHDDKTFWVV